MNNLKDLLTEYATQQKEIVVSDEDIEEFTKQECDKFEKLTSNKSANFGQGVLTGINFMRNKLTTKED